MTGEPCEIRDFALDLTSHGEEIIPVSPEITSLTILYYCKGGFYVILPLLEYNDIRKRTLWFLLLYGNDIRHFAHALS